MENMYRGSRDEPTAHAVRQSIFEINMCLSTAIGCQLMQAETSVSLRFFAALRQVIRLTMPKRYAVYWRLPSLCDALPVSCNPFDETSARYDRWWQIVLQNS